MSAAPHSSRLNLRAVYIIALLKLWLQLKYDVSHLRPEIIKDVVKSVFRLVNDNEGSFWLQLTYHGRQLFAPLVVCNAELPHRLLARLASTAIVAPSPKPSCRRLLHTPWTL